ncbi:solute carrier family 41 member 3 isoform X5 [Balaenoptera ricei]|uniref:solute carrier family 41 member 3 isoform X5 n=1 Tax=Balaenoptera ricei TaxID=2746895 RepID=UPI0028BE6602|nr:solute carrier family 41 member 3 isoform X5 [Balaenoptera ricei]XP_059796541.1 solute carrier family 41 member 3 isoform X5 [Balaenoptera ricei]
MDGTETRQRRPEELGLLHGLSTGRLPEASEDGLLSVPESQRVAPKPLGPELSRETTLSIGLQVTVPFLFAGLGLSGAGILLNYFQHWPVFTEVKDLLTLVPPLVGLKGNLEMTLASRLSTAANTGQIDDPQEQHRVISSNLALIQVQATVVGLLAAVAALLLGAASGQELDVVEAEVLCASSVITAFLAACALDEKTEASDGVHLSGKDIAGIVPRDADGLHSDRRPKARGQPGQHCDAHRGQPGRPHHLVPPGVRQQLLPQTQRQSVSDAAGLRQLHGPDPHVHPRRQAEPARREDPQVRVVPHRPGDASQQFRGAHLEQDHLQAAVPRHGHICPHHLWCWWQPGGHSDQPDLHVPTPVEHARGPAPRDEKMLA